LQSISNGAVSFLRASVSRPTGNADTITNALGPYPNQAARDLIFGAASTGFFTYSTAACGGGSVGGPGVGTSLVGAGLGAVPVVGGVLKTIFGAFGAHHANAVRNEQATLCTAVPDANNFLRGIDTAIATGQLDTASAAQALEQGYQNWRGEVGAILQDTGGHCNAACIYEKAFRAAIEFRKQNFALIDAQQQSGAQGLLQGVVDAAQGVISTVRGAVSPSQVSYAGGGGAYPSTMSVLSQAGLTPARQSTLAGAVIIGGVLVLGFVWMQFIKGATKK
jgi:hypothetical protein